MSNIFTVVKNKLSNLHYSVKKRLRAHDEMVDFENLPFNVVEGFNALGVNLSYLIPEGGTKKICVSSAIAGEGKTTIAVNSAITLSKTGAKVLIVDADLRRPRVHKHFGVTRKDGLADVLCFIKEPEDVVVKTKYEGLDFISAGNITPAPLRLLSSDGLQKVFDTFDGKYDWIIFDTPPINVVTDMLLVLPKTHGVVMVIDAKQTDHNVLSHVINTVTTAGGNILGVVLNKMDEKSYNYKSRYGYRYAHKYGYKYKYGHGSGYGYSSEIKENDGEKV